MEASKRKFLSLTFAGRNAILLGEDATPRKDTALHLLHNLRRISKFSCIDDSTDLATIFSDNKSRPKLPAVRSEILPLGTLSNEVLYGKGVNSMKGRDPSFGD
jgi:hypothetical protein